MSFGKGFEEMNSSMTETKSQIEFDPNNRFEQFKEKTIETVKNVFDPDKKIDIYNSSKEERILYTPAEGTERGSWKDGTRGDGIFVPNKNFEEGIIVANKLSKYGLDGIAYNSGVIDLSRCSLEKVSIDNMTDKRYQMGGNFEQADTKLANQWNNSYKDGKANWSARDVKAYRHENELTWHECSDLKTCMLVDRTVHDFFNHSGGVFEYKQGMKTTDVGGIFDE